MNELHKQRLLEMVNHLIAEADEVILSKFYTDVIGAPTFVNSQLLHKWWGKVVSFGHCLGTAAKPWQTMFATNPEHNTLGFVQQVLGTLEAIKYEIENDHLAIFTKLVRAETLADLLDQAQHLFNNGYNLAAGVIGRAVLEEHLRVTCATLGCTPSKEHPTINDFNQVLYSSQHYSKIKMKQIDTLASIGNNAAHNKPDLTSENVKKMLSDLPELIESTSV